MEFQACPLSEEVSGMNDMVAHRISTAEQIEQLTQGIANARPGNNSVGGTRVSECKAVQQVKMFSGDRAHFR